MVVFKDRAGHGVVRVPLRSEPELVAKSGEYQNGVSNLTHDEITRYHLLEDRLGGCLAPVAPFYAYDSSGQLRTYSLQRYTPFTRDLRTIDTWENPETATKDSLRELIDRIRLLIKETGLIPDLAGANNVVMNGGNRAKLIDVNNIQPLLSREEWSNRSEAELRQDWHRVISHRVMKDYISPGYLDDKGYPVADASVLVMRNWEKILGKRDADLDKDEVYGVIADGTMRDRLLSFFLHSDL